jgi:hypothetical protein
MPRIFKIAVFATVCITALILVLLNTHRLQSSALYIHVDSIPWSTVTVESSNLSRPQQFDRSTREVRVSPILHGVYRIRVQLSDGQSIWSQFFHYDAGVRRRIDVFLEPSQTSGQIHFRQTANQNKQLFNGDARPEDTTEEKPLTLDWI